MTTPATPLQTLTIDDLGSGGDGIARAGGKLWFVPYALPGDTIAAKPVSEKGEGQVWARLMDVITPSPDRVGPPCPQFGLCGGCMLQDWSPAAYKNWKRRTVLDRLAKAGWTPESLETVFDIPAKSRRRATLCARRVKGKTILGFNRHHSDEVVDLPSCTVLVPELETLLPALRDLMGHLLHDVKQADVSITALGGGVDVLITAPLDLNLLMHEALAEFAQGNNIGRIALRAQERMEPEILLDLHPLSLSWGTASVRPAPGAFLQPSRAGEQALVKAVTAGVGDAAKVADLFSGLGTFTFPLAEGGRQVTGIDADGPAIRALKSAIGDRNIAAQARNLYKSPLNAAELKAFDAVVFDPPRAGAKAQAPEIAASGIPRIVSVSCNPATFVTDAQAFKTAGYDLESLTIVDQFAYSNHVELVGVFTRG